MIFQSFIVRHLKPVVPASADQCGQRRDETAEAAFGTLVDRHGAMVLRVFRQVLGDEHDAQDAAQATFLILARRAGSISRRESVASWLHGVALRVSARARLAGSRRRARERRVAESMAARLVVQNEIGPGESHERFTLLHDELSRLPDSFRDPLVLCYIEGLTQEEAAAQLRCPLGTIQSRLARGRAKLKSRLTKRGFELSAVLSEVGSGAQSFSPAPEAWVAATVRMAMQFTQAKGSGIAAGSAPLAEDVLRTMIVTKLRVAGGAFMCAAILVTGAATWGRQESRANSRAVVTNAARLEDKPQPAPVPRKPLDPLEEISVRLRGVVRDELGHPVAQAWVGSSFRMLDDVWKPVRAESIREPREPFRDGGGSVVPSGSLGSFFELHDGRGNWRPIHPHDIRPNPPEGYAGETVDILASSGTQLTPVVAPFEVRAFSGHPRIGPSESTGEDRCRTDAEGHFAVVLKIRSDTSVTLHAASRNFSHRAVKVVRADDPDRAIELILKPVRMVHARVIEAPIDHPELLLDWELFPIGESGLHARDLDFLWNHAAKWGEWPTEPTYLGGAALPDGGGFKSLLTAGRYRIWFHSDTTERLVDFEVPAGDSPLELPDIHLETLAWVKMVGKPPAEIDAIGLDGKPVTLADFRGKVVVLVFCAGWPDEKLTWFELLANLRRRYKNKPFEIIALHDASITSVEARRPRSLPNRRSARWRRVRFDHLAQGARRSRVSNFRQEQMPRPEAALASRRPDRA